MVLHVRVVSGSGGGPDKTIIRSPGGIDPARYRMAAAYIHPHGDEGIDAIRRHAAERNCPLFTIPERGALDPRTVHALHHLCRRLHVTVWHGHDYKSNLLGLVLRKLWPMKLVTTAHGWTRESRRTRLYYHIDNWCLSRYDEVIAVSPPIYEHCLLHKVKVTNLTYVPNAIEPGEYEREQSRDAARRALGLRGDRFVIGVVGRFSIEKGVDRAVRMIASLRQRHRHVELHLVGGGAEHDKLKRLAQELDVDDAVVFHGWQTALKPYYEMMDMLLLPSHTEGLPNVVLEAMAMGVPVAATDVGGVRELLDDGQAGVVLAQDDSTWLDAVAPLIDDAAARDMLAARARQRVVSRYSFTRRMASVAGVYDKLLRIVPDSLRPTITASPAAPRQTKPITLRDAA